MFPRQRKRSLWFAGVVCAAALGCATTADLDSLRQELAETRQIAEAAQRDAQQASAAARAASADAREAAQNAADAAAEARAASEKADKIFQARLRK